MFEFFVLLRQFVYFVIHRKKHRTKTHKNTFPRFINLQHRIHNFWDVHFKMFIITNQIIFTAVETFNGHFNVRLKLVLLLSVFNLCTCGFSTADILDMQQWIWQVSVWKDLSYPLKMLGSVTLCALTVTTGTEVSKLKRHRGEATLYLNHDSKFPVRWMLARRRRRTVFAENTTVIWRGCDSFGVSSVYLQYLFAFVKTTIQTYWSILSYGVHLIVICDQGEWVHHWIVKYSDCYIQAVSL